jgi:hypothetical protein
VTTVAPSFSVLELASCHTNGAWNYEVASSVLENLCTPGYLVSYDCLNGKKCDRKRPWRDFRKISHDVPEGTE